jgi:hypothetical protein
VVVTVLLGFVCRFVLNHLEIRELGGVVSLREALLHRHVAMGIEAVCVCVCVCIVFINEKEVEGLGDVNGSTCMDACGCVCMLYLREETAVGGLLDGHAAVMVERL